MAPLTPEKGKPQKRKGSIRAVARTVLGRVCGRVDGVRVGLEEVDLGAAHAAYSVSILHRERERERKSQFHQRRE